MFKKQKPLFLILFLLFPLFLFAQEIEYPPVPGTPTPGAETEFPGYVNYLFNFALGIAGIVAFGVLIWAGILYLTSAGSPEQTSKAKQKALGAFLGLIILFFSYFILATLNPQLTILHLPSFNSSLGVCLCPRGVNCEKNCKGEKNFFITTSQKSLNLPSVSQYQIIFYTDFLPVYVFKKENFDDSSDWLSRKEMETSGEINFNPKSIYFAQPKGVCLYDFIINESAITTQEDLKKKEFKHFPPHFLCLSESVLNLSLAEPNFNDKAQSVVIYSDDSALLFEKEGYEGKCTLICPTNALIDVPNLSNSPGGRDYFNIPATNESSYCWGVKQSLINNPPIEIDTASSVKILKDNKSASLSGSVTFYDRADCQGEEYQVPNNALGNALGMVDFGIDKPDEEIKFSDGKKVFENIVSIKIEGTYGVILNTRPDGSGNCQFFEKPENTTNCISSLIGSAVYESTPESPEAGYQTNKVRQTIVVPLRK